MIAPPPEVKKGEPITAAWANRLRESVLARTPLKNADIGIRPTPAGYTTWIKRNSGGGGIAGVSEHPWQPFQAPYTGEGDPPADQGRKLSIRPGSVRLGGTTLIPSNKNIVITVPANDTEGFFVWLEIGILASSGTYVASSLVYGSGSTLPAAPLPDIEEGTPPNKVYVPIFYATSFAAAIDRVEQLVSSSLSVAIVITNLGCDTKTLEVQISEL